MNSRLKLSKSVISNVLQKINAGPSGLNELLSCDEIMLWRREGGAFKPFQEAPITFPPTYKYLVGGSEYDVGQSGSVCRVPAWCDRVLFYGPVTCLKYDHCPSFKASDHKPVIAVLEFQPESEQIFETLAHQLSFNREKTYSDVSHSSFALDHVMSDRTDTSI